MVMMGCDSLLQPLCDRISLWYSEVINIDAVLPQIQSEREPEIIRAQQLQSQEAAQTELLRKSALLRYIMGDLPDIISDQP